MRIFILLLFCFPFSLMAQSQAEYIIDKVNAQINDTIPFKTIIKYKHHSWNIKDIKSHKFTQYFKLVDTTQFGYKKFDYLIENDVRIFFKFHKLKKLYSESKPTENPNRGFGIDELFPGYKSIENPLIFGIIPTNKTDEIKLDSNKNEYHITINLGQKSIQNALDDTLITGAYKIQYEYFISKKDFKITKTTKLVQTDKGDLFSSLEFKTKALKDQKFDKKLRKFFDNSLFMNLDEIVAEQRKIIYPEDSLIHFKIKSLDGKIFDTENDSTNIFVLDFWFAACGPCRMAMPYLDSLHEKYKDHGVAVIGLNGIDKDTSEILKVIQLTKINYPTSMDALELVRELKVQTYPYLIILDKNRKIIFAESGFTKDKMKEIDKLIAEELEK